VILVTIPLFLFSILFWNRLHIVESTPKQKHHNSTSIVGTILAALARVVAVLVLVHKTKHLTKNDLTMVVNYINTTT